MNESRGIELKDSRRRPQVEPCSSSIGWPRLLGVPTREGHHSSLGPSLGQSVQSVQGSRLALSVHRRLYVGPGAGNIWPRGTPNCRNSGEGHTSRGTALQGLCDPVGQKQFYL